LEASARAMAGFDARVAANLCSRAVRCWENGLARKLDARTIVADLGIITYSAAYRR
jgi:hypothetical protein